MRVTALPTFSNMAVVHHPILCHSELLTKSTVCGCIALPKFVVGDNEIFMIMPLYLENA